MNKKITIIIAIVLVIALAVLMVVLLHRKSFETVSKEPGKEQDVDNGSDSVDISNENDDIVVTDNAFAVFVSKDEVEKYVKENPNENFVFEENIFYSPSTAFLGQKANLTVEFDEDDSIRYVKAAYVVFSPNYVQGEVVSGGGGSGEAYDEDDTSIKEEHLEVVESEPYEFTSEDKETILNNFDKLRQSVENQLGCKLEWYNALPTGISSDFENDNDDDFLSGYYIREYVVKDKNGEMWRVIFEASYGTASSTIERFCKEADAPTKFPTIDLTKI